MNTIEVRLNGHPNDTSELVRIARAAGLEVSSHRLILNSATAPPAEVVVIVGLIAAVARCVNTFLRERKRRLEIIRPDEKIYAENYSVEELTKVFEAGGHIGIKKLKTTQRKKGGRANESERE
jgi:hypothetical protein